jgi:hypothetical protein
MARSLSQRRRLSPLGALLALAAASGCTDDEIVWVPFNAEDQTLEIEVLPEGSEIGDPVGLDLMSNLGLTNVGVAGIDPGSGPVGTEHLVTVEVFDEFETFVGRVTLGVNPEATKDLDGDGEIESRGSEEYEMLQDSADPGSWALTVQSLGADDERRQDTFTIVLWQPEELLAETTAQ